TIEIIENGVLDNAATLGGYLIESLRELKERYDCIVDVRGLGLMIGIEFARDPEAVNPWPELRDNIVADCFNRGLVIQGAGESAIRFSPPLIIDREQADFAVKTLEESIRVSL
ncbi:MAG TPA: aminotransferase class III-fold pyridoxal phosphate-dependent enzyme, partial [Blastocatellia bacterium]|nr:aminotransferase class III-fold pyridoxal phosphate-dependent enzyme [Blastocatellia bacterium]